MNMAKLVNIDRDLARDAGHVLSGILRELPGLDVHLETRRGAGDHGEDLLVTARSRKSVLQFGVHVKSRVTPQVALDLFQKLPRAPKAIIRVIYAPVISPRVAELARAQGVSYFDRAGNCLLKSADKHLLIERRGIPAERRPTPAAVDPFSTKSSRIVRALLSRPLDGWQLRKLADHPEVRVSAGLAVKVKRALVEEGYAVERERLLCLRDPLGLLKAWVPKYPGPAEQVAVYFRGDAARAEDAIAGWCAEEGIQYALAGMSAAWRLAPEVRHNLGSVYVDARGFEAAALERLATKHGGKRVTSGANLVLWRAYDPSVFAFREQPFTLATSPLQTYLDLRKLAGRGEDAAKAIFEKCLKHDFEAAARRAEEWLHADI